MIHHAVDLMGNQISHAVVYGIHERRIERDAVAVEGVIPYIKIVVMADRRPAVKLLP